MVNSFRLFNSPYSETGTVNVVSDDVYYMRQVWIRFMRLIYLLIHMWISVFRYMWKNSKKIETFSLDIRIEVKGWVMILLKKLCVAR